MRTNSLSVSERAKRPLVSFDWAMKHMLRNQANFDILEGFLTALLKRDIKVLSLLESEGNQDHAEDKYNRVDLRVQDDTGEEIIIEIQYVVDAAYLQRLVYGTAKAIVNKMEAGDSFSKVPKIISVSIIYFPLTINADKRNNYLYHNVGGFWASRLNLFVDIQVEALGESSINSFPEYYLIEVNNFDGDIVEPLDEWTYLFKNSEIHSNFSSKNIQLARQKLDRMRMSQQERKSYDKYWEDAAVNKDIDQRLARINKEEGERVGERKALQNTLHLLLTSKFGELSSSVEGRLEEASSEQLNAWFLKALTATTLEEVLQ